MKHLLFIAAFMPLFVAVDIKGSEAIDCSSPVWRSTSQCLRKKSGPNLSNIRASEGDLGGADLIGKGFVQIKSFQAKCGEKARKCEVSFTDGRLSINGGEGITNDQLVDVVRTKTCRKSSTRKGLFRRFSKCQYENDYLITYKDKNGNTRVALIAFDPDKFIGKELDYQVFYRELIIWESIFSGKILGK